VGPLRGGAPAPAANRGPARALSPSSPGCTAFGRQRFRAHRPRPKLIGCTERPELHHVGARRTEPADFPGLQSSGNQGRTCSGPPSPDRLAALRLFECATVCRVPFGLRQTHRAEQLQVRGCCAVPRPRNDIIGAADRIRYSSIHSRPGAPAGPGGQIWRSALPAESFSVRQSWDTSILVGFDPRRRPGLSSPVRTASPIPNRIATKNAGPSFDPHHTGWLGFAEAKSFGRRAFAAKCTTKLRHRARRLQHVADRTGHGPRSPSGRRRQAQLPTSASLRHRTRRAGTYICSPNKSSRRRVLRRCRRPPLYGPDRIQPRSNSAAFEDAFRPVSRSLGAAPTQPCSSPRRSGGRAVYGHRGGRDHPRRCLSPAIRAELLPASRSPG